MNLKTPIFFTRIFSLFLTVTLFLPSPLFALRQVGLEESDSIKAQLIARMKESRFPQGAGLEEETGVVQQLFDRFEQWFNPELLDNFAQRGRTGYRIMEKKHSSFPTIQIGYLGPAEKKASDFVEVQFEPIENFPGTFRVQVVRQRGSGRSAGRISQIYFRRVHELLRTLGGRWHPSLPRSIFPGQEKKTYFWQAPLGKLAPLNGRRTVQPSIARYLRFYKGKSPLRVPPLAEQMEITTATLYRHLPLLVREENAWRAIERKGPIRFEVRKYQVTRKPIANPVAAMKKVLSNYPGGKLQVRPFAREAGMSYQTVYNHRAALIQGAQEINASRPPEKAIVLPARLFKGPASTGLEELVPYDELVQRQKKLAPIGLPYLHGEKLAPEQIPRFIRIKPPQRIFIPLDHPALEGIRIVREGVIQKKAGVPGKRVAPSYARLDLLGGFKRSVRVFLVPQPKGSDRSLPSNKPTPEQLGFLVEKLDRGILVIPRVPLYLEYVPGELELSVDDESYWAQIVRQINNETTEYLNLEARLAHPGPRQLLYRDGDPAEGMRLYRSVIEKNRAYLALVFYSKAWDKRALESLVGPHNPQDWSWDYPVRITDKLVRVIHVHFTELENGTLYMTTPLESAERLSHTLGVVIRLMAKLTVHSSGMTSYSHIDQFSDSKVLKEVVKKDGPAENPALRRRYLANVALLYRDFKEVLVPLKRLEREEEPLAPFRLGTIVHLFRRQEGDHKFTLPQRRKIVAVLARLLIGNVPDSDEGVRMAAVQTLARLTPNRPEDLTRSLRILRQIRDNDEESRRIREGAGDLVDILRNQRRQGEGLPVRLGLGLPVDFQFALPEEGKSIEIQLEEPDQQDYFKRLLHLMGKNVPIDPDRGILTPEDFMAKSRGEITFPDDPDAPDFEAIHYSRSEHSGFENARASLTARLPNLPWIYERLERLLPHLPALEPSEESEWYRVRRPGHEKSLPIQVVVDEENQLKIRTKDEPVAELWDRLSILVALVARVVRPYPGDESQGLQMGGGLEEGRLVPAEEFILGLSPEERARAPSRMGQAVWVAPLSNIYIYAPETLTAGLEERFKKKVPPDLQAALAIVPLPLSPTGRYQRPGIIVKDCGLNESVANPLNLPILEVWLADLDKVDPAAMIRWALTGYQDTGVKLLLMTYKDATGKKYLAIFV